MENLSTGFIVPTIVVTADIHIVSPEQLRQDDKWPDFKSIVNATGHDIKEHAWFQLRAQLRVDRGKGRAVDDDQGVERFGSPEDMEVDKDSDAEVDKDSMAKAVSTPQSRPGPSVQPGAADSSGVSGSDSSPPHGHDRSRTRRPKKRVKLAATVTTDDENDTEPVATRIRLSVRDIDTPGTGYAWASDDERCQRCKKRNLRCAIYPGRACWQCACTKLACSATVVVRAQSTARSQARRTPTRCVTRSPTRASTTGSPSRVTTPGSLTRRRSQSRHRKTSMSSSGRQRMSIIYFFCFT